MSKYETAKHKIGKKFVSYGNDIAGVLNEGNDDVIIAYNIGALMQMLEDEMKKIVEELEAENDK